MYGPFGPSPVPPFAGTGVTDAGAKFLADALAEHPFITALDLTGVWICPCLLFQGF